MKERPILFSTPMIQAIMRGEKTMTRRTIKEKVPIGNRYETLKHCPYGQIGDVLWVRETWQHTKCLNISPDDDNYGYIYKADWQPWEDFEEWTWKPSIFMPREACRIRLKITDIRVERLEDITKEDAIAEGIEKWEQMCQIRYKSYVEPMVGFWDDGSHLQTGGVHPAIASFRSLWASINGFDNLNSNPWVWAITFEKL